MVSLMYFWVQIPNEIQVLRLSDTYRFINFVPTTVSVLWLIFLLKNYLNIKYLQRKGLEHANSSRFTSELYWFRVIYDFVAIGSVLIIFSILKSNESKLHDLVIKPPPSFINDEVATNKDNKVITSKLFKTIHKLNFNLPMGNNFIVFVIFLPMFLLEAKVYWFSKAVADER